MHLKLKVGGWDYKIHWNKNFSLGFGSLLNLKRGGCIWRVETKTFFCEACTAPLHMSICQVVSVRSTFSLFVWLVAGADLF
jgi:hypothetical protein